MKRRALLGTLATATASALAGCIGVLGDDADPTDDSPTTDDPTTDSPTSSEPTTDDDPFEYAVADVRTDDAPVADVSMDVTIQQQFSTDQPAVLRVAFTNEADEAREFQFGSLVPWDAIRGTHDETKSGLLLAPGTGVAPDEPEDDCWRATDGVALPMVMKSETIGAGETVSHEFRVLATHDSEACHPAGTYRFEDEGYLGEGWGFSVSIVEADSE